MGRRLGFAASVLAGVITLSGCVVFKTAPTARLNHGKVVIKVKGCASQSSGTPAGSCTNQGNSNLDASNGASQVFLGFRVPAKSSPPQSFSAKTGPASGGPKLKFTHSKTYTHQLATLAPAPAGQKWVGYWSQSFTYSATSGQQSFTAKAAFALPKSFKGKFKYKTVIGGRNLGLASSSQKINCKGDSGTGSLTTTNQDNGTVVICVDDSAHSSLQVP